VGVFLHPHLTRGVVKTARGAFQITRGRIEMPDDIGESLGWRRVEEDETPAEPRERLAHRMSAAEAGHPEACPWCGQQRIRGITPPHDDGNRHYRCAACGTTFFINALPQRAIEGERLLAPTPAHVPRKKAVR
jgi:predicted RNA-binding Zn-ribbon protein involved in translation (DUF1610 family)